MRTWCSFGVRQVVGVLETGSLKNGPTWLQRSWMSSRRSGESARLIDQEMELLVEEEIGPAVALGDGGLDPRGVSS